MSRRSRRSGVPEDVVRHSPVPFDDSLDLPESQEGFSPPGVPLLSDSAYPLTPAPESSPRIVTGVWGRSPQAKPLDHYSDALRARRWLAARQRALSHAKRVSRDLAQMRRDRERSRLLFNVIATPFSKRARFCVMRKIRREVLFAKKYNGRNGGRKYERSYTSHYKC